MTTYLIEHTNGEPDYWTSDAESSDDVLDEYCQEAGYDNQADALGVLGGGHFNISQIDTEPGICDACSGSGEGQYDGSVCPVCRGLGE